MERNKESGVGGSDGSAKESPCSSENSGMEGDEMPVAGGGGRQEDQKKVSAERSCSSQ